MSFDAKLPVVKIPKETRVRLDRQVEARRAEGLNLSDLIRQCVAEGLDRRDAAEGK